MPSADTWLDTLQAVLGGHPVVLDQLFDAGVSLLRPDANKVTLLSRAVLREPAKAVSRCLRQASISSPSVKQLAQARAPQASATAAEAEPSSGPALCWLQDNHALCCSFLGGGLPYRRGQQQR